MRPSSGSGGSHLGSPGLEKEGAKVPEFRIKVAPHTVAYADGESRKLVVEFAIPGRQRIPSI